MKAIHGIIAAATALTLNACAGGTGMDGATGPRPKTEARAVMVQVQNNNWSDMVVYLVQGTQRVRLGMVTSMSTQSFPVARSAISSTGQVRLMADPIGSSRGYLSDPLNVRPGQRVALDVGHNLATSFVSVWN